MAVPSRATKEAEERRGESERQPRGQPLRRHLAEHHEFEGHRLGGHQVEGAVFFVGLEQAVEPDQRRQHRGEPQDRRADPRQQVQVRPEGEGTRATIIRKKTSDRAPEPPTRPASLQVAGDEGEKPRVTPIPPAPSSVAPVGVVDAQFGRAGQARD